MVPQCRTSDERTLLPYLAQFKKAFNFWNNKSRICVSAFHCVYCIIFFRWLNPASSFSPPWSPRHRLLEPQESSSRARTISRLLYDMWHQLAKHSIAIVPIVWQCLPKNAAFKFSQSHRTCSPVRIFHIWLPTQKNMPVSKHELKIRCSSNADSSHNISANITRQTLPGDSRSMHRMTNHRSALPINNGWSQKFRERPRISHPPEAPVCLPSSALADLRCRVISSRVQLNVPRERRNW